MMIASPLRLRADATHLLVVDVQQKLFPRIRDADSVLRNINFLLDACRILEVPAIATEQYPKGLGPTLPELAAKLPSPVPEKLAFSCCAVPSVLEEFRISGRATILVVGIETHVCVMQTVLDLLARGFQTFVAVDAVGGRYAIDHDAALRRMEQAGAVLCTAEMAAFELTVQAGTTRFKQISTLVQERMKHQKT
jgi:nicotinamidase-related amidase